MTPSYPYIEVERGFCITEQSCTVQVGRNSLSAVTVEVQGVDSGAVEPPQLLLLAQLQLREALTAVRAREEPRWIQPALTGREKLQHDRLAHFSSR